MKTPQNAPFCIKSAKQILGGGGKPHQTPPLFQVWLIALQKRLATPLAYKTELSSFVNIVESESKYI